MDKDWIFVTKPSLPPLDEFVDELKKIWNNEWLTNNGPFHQQFEKELASFLGVKHCSLFSNGTLALLVGLQALRISGEVITTPYSFVATTHALHWNNIKPVFVDIENGFNITPQKVEAAITPKTTAIMPVHIYGTPCDVDGFEKLAKTYGLKIIYDAAHAFNIKVDGNSILNYGDLSILSFHATKVFNTIEGGAIITNDGELKKRIDYLKNFGFADEMTIVAPGINAKMNELQAAYGSLQLKYVNKAIEKRKKIAEFYSGNLKSIQGIDSFEFDYIENYNYSYYPVLVNDEFAVDRDKLYDIFKANKIFSRKYFYPLISHFPIYRGLESSKPENLPNAEYVSKHVLCLPIYESLKKSELEKVLNVILNIDNYL